MTALRALSATSDCWRLNLFLVKRSGKPQLSAAWSASLPTLMKLADRWTCKITAAGHCQPLGTTYLQSGRYSSAFCRWLLTGFVVPEASKGVTPYSATHAPRISCPASLSVAPVPDADHSANVRFDRPGNLGRTSAARPLPTISRSYPNSAVCGALP